MQAATRRISTSLSSATVGIPSHAFTQAATRRSNIERGSAGLLGESSMMPPGRESGDGISQFYNGTNRPECFTYFPGRRAEQAPEVRPAATPTRTRLIAVAEPGPRGPGPAWTSEPPRPTRAEAPRVAAAPVEVPTMRPTFDVAEIP